MNALAEFDGLTLRNADSLADLERLYEWVNSDENHRGMFPAQYFMSGPLAADSRPSCYALEDDNGVMFYIRLSRAARVRIQFAPAGEVDRGRVKRGLFNGMAFLENALAGAGCEEWIFDTVNPELRSMAKRVLGFTDSEHELVRPIAEPGKAEEVG
jgi:hypothetical protein